jgi:glycosyltransferase involved in cell wall biosynthesis
MEKNYCKSSFSHSKGLGNRLRIFIPFFGFGKAGGYRVLSCLANGLAKRGYLVTIIVPSETQPPYYPINADVKIETIDNLGRPSATPTFFDRKPFKPLVAMVSIFLYLRRTCIGSDLVIANYNLTSYPVFFSGKGQRFYYIQAYEPDLIEGSVVDPRIAGRKLLAWGSYFLPLKRIVNAQVYKNYKNIRSNDVSYPGIDSNNFYARTNWHRQQDQLIVGCVGRKEAWKGGAIAANAIKKMRALGFNIKLSTAINPLPIEDQQIYKPNNDRELGDFYRSVDVILVSVYGQHGSIHYPVLEAMACNIPLVTTHYYPATSQNSFLVESRSEDSIVDALQEVYQNYNTAVAKASIALKAVEEFYWDQIVEKFDEKLRL